MAPWSTRLRCQPYVGSCDSSGWWATAAPRTGPAAQAGVPAGSGAASPDAAAAAGGASVAKTPMGLVPSGCPAARLPPLPPPTVVLLVTDGGGAVGHMPASAMRLPRPLLPGRLPAQASDSSCPRGSRALNVLASCHAAYARAASLIVGPEASSCCAGASRRENPPPPWPPLVLRPAAMPLPHWLLPRQSPPWLPLAELLGGTLAGPVCSDALPLDGTLWVCSVRARRVSSANPTMPAASTQIAALTTMPAHLGGRMGGKGRGGCFAGIGAALTPSTLSPQPQGQSHPGCAPAIALPLSPPLAGGRCF